MTHTDTVTATRIKAKEMITKEMIFLGITSNLARHTTLFSDGINTVESLLLDDSPTLAEFFSEEVAMKIYLLDF
tara:strand:- start:297 stop:518 length:222 start_codon:yes stop_codon:yes gene_type:complete